MNSIKFTRHISPASYQVRGNTSVSVATQDQRSIDDDIKQYCIEKLESEKHILELVLAQENLEPGSIKDAEYQIFERRFTLDQLQRIWQAEERYSKGTYGKCLRCNRQIEWDRLKIIPYAEHCIECQKLIEG